MTHRYSKFKPLIVFLGDIASLNFAFAIALVTLDDYVPIDYKFQYAVLFTTLNIFWILITLIINPYKEERVFSIMRIVRRTVIALTLHILASTSFLFAIRFSSVAREQFVLGFTLFFMILIIWRISFSAILRIYRSKGYNQRDILIIGYGELGIELEEYIQAHPEHGYNLIGYFDNNHSNENILGKLDQLEQYCQQNNIDEMYCCLPHVEYSYIKEVVLFGEENLIKVKLIVDFRGFSFKGVELERYDHIPVLNVTSIPLDDKLNRVLKRVFDVAFSLLVIVLLFSWLFPIIAIFIKIDSKGPVFFKQYRTGKDNQTFLCYKFRTMVVNTDSDKVQATKDDKRITKLGSFLRKTSLDELPQFLNVFIGTMSVVGPRPHMLKHTEEYAQRVERFMARHFVKPGVTGLAQAKGHRGETETLLSMKNRVKLDRFYIENWSLVLDVKIILLTIVSLIKGEEKAY